MADRGSELVVLLAHAKVNLWLNVVGRRADGYHLLDTLVAFIDLADTLVVAPSDRLTLEVTGPQAATVAGQSDNLVLKAARLLAERFQLPARAAFALTKNIPVAAGLAGGSADAAAAMLALREAWRLEISRTELEEISLVLGADVPMCLGSRTVIARGIGEQLHAAPALPPCGLLLVNPGVELPTAEVFRARTGPYSAPRALGRAWTDLTGLVADLAERGNDLAEAAIFRRPVIGEVLAFLRRSERVRYAAMTGSGATCFALFGSTGDARHVAATVPAAWWRHAGRFIPG